MVPHFVAQAAVERDDGGGDIIDTVWNYSTATLMGIGACVGGHCLGILFSEVTIVLSFVRSVTITCSLWCFHIVAQAAAEQKDGFIDTVWNYSPATLADIADGLIV